MQKLTASLFPVSLARASSLDNPNSADSQSAMALRCDLPIVAIAAPAGILPRLDSRSLSARRSSMASSMLASYSKVRRSNSERSR